MGGGVGGMSGGFGGQAGGFGGQALWLFNKYYPGKILLRDVA